MGTIVSGTRTVDGAALADRAGRAARGLAALGIVPGDVVALCLRNDAALFEASIAAATLGAYATPINWHSVVQEARYIFADSGARAIVIHADLVESLRIALPADVPVFVVPTPPEILSAYSIDASQALVPPGMVDWDQWLADFSPMPAGGGSIGSMIYTSGTTGHPKGVRRAPATAEQARDVMTLRDRIWGFDLFGDDGRSRIVTVMTGPMYHSAPNAYGLLAARIGATLILQPRFDPEDLLALVEKHRVTHLHMVPIMFHRLLALPEALRRRYDLSSLRFIAHGAAPVSIAIKNAMIDWLGPIIHEYYGSTESSAVTWASSEEWLERPGTVGRAAPGGKVRVLDSDGRAAAAGTIGEIAARSLTSPDFTYHGDDAKRAAVDRDGLISVGDIGYLDDDGYLFLCDRSTEVIISGGVNIYPAEIEASILRIEGVVDCAVIGVPDPEFGEKLCAIIQLVPGACLEAEDVRDQLRGNVSAYKIPKLVEFRMTLPREDSGKLFKRRLRAEYWPSEERRI